MDYTDPKTKQVYPQPAGPPGARERDARADPPAVLVRRPAVRHPRRRVRPLRPQPPGRRHRRHLLRHPAGPEPDGVRPGRDAASTSPTGSAATSTRRTVAKHPIRQAVIEAAQITQQNLPGQPTLDFPPADGPEFKEAMAQGPGGRRADRLHRRRGAGADQRRGQAAATARPRGAGRRTTT